MTRRARRPLSAVAAIGGFGIGVALLSVAATATIVLIAPEPDGVRVSLSEAAGALRANTPGFERRVGAEPQGRRAVIFEAVLASQLQRPAKDVRIVMTGPDSFSADRLRLVGRQPPVLVLRTVTSGERTGAGALSGGATRQVFRSNDARALLPTDELLPAVRAGLATVPISAFVASVRQADGRWLTVEPHQPWLSGWRVRVLAAILVSLLLIAPLAWLFARRLTRPFRVLAHAVDVGDTQIPIAGPRELREAASAIGTMRARLASETAERLRMLTAIAHDLRTPLTSLRLRIDAADEPQRSRMVADVQRMQAMIGEVLEFTREAEAQRRPIAVRPLIVDVVSEMDAGQGLLELLSGDDARIAAAEPAFRRAIENLVRNAVDYAGGGSVSIAAELGEVIITVSDSGPGIPTSDLPRLLLPFERGEASRNRETGGAGLGLSIVQDFADRNDGTLIVRNRDEGGLIVRLRLPALEASILES